jgi:hypothetical protein
MTGIRLIIACFFMAISAVAYGIDCGHQLRIVVTTAVLSGPHCSFDEDSAQGIVNINGRELPFKMTDYTGESNCKKWTQLESCFGIDLLVVGENRFNYGWTWQRGGVNRAHLSEKITLKGMGSDNILYENVINQDVEAFNVDFSKSYSLQQIAPRVYRGIENARNQIKNWLLNEILAKRYPEKIAGLRDILEKIDGLSLEEIDPSIFDNSVWPEGRAVLESLRKPIVETTTRTEAMLAKAKEIVEKIEQNAAAELEKLDTSITDLPPEEFADSLFDVEGDLTTDEDLDPWDPENDHYARFADETIRKLEGAWQFDDRIGFFSIVASWAEHNKMFERYATSRAEVSPKEWRAYSASVTRIESYLYGNGQVQGRLTRDNWYIDSPVPQDLRNDIENIIKVESPAEGAALELALKQLRKKDVSAQQAEAFMTLRALAHGFVALASMLEVQEAIRQRQKLQSVAGGMALLIAEGAKCAGTSFVARDAGDFYEVVTGKDICTGETLTVSGRTISAIALGVGSARIWRWIGQRMGIKTVSDSISENVEAFEAFASRAGKEQAIRMLQSAETLGITSKGMKVYAKIYLALETLPAGLRAKRIREGVDPNKIAFIGRSMGGGAGGRIGVLDAAAHFKSLNISVETFDDVPGFAALTDQRKAFNRLNGLPEGTPLPKNEVIKSIMYNRNKAWAEDKVKGGYTIVDLGDPNGINEFSAFYSMEKAIFFGGYRE